MNTKTFEILLLEDSSSDAELIQHMLQDHDTFNANVTWVTRFAEASEAIASDSFSLIFSDLGLPDSQGLDTISKLKSLTKQVPIIALTGDQTELGINAIRAGADDFIAKNQINKPLMARTIQYTIERFQMTADLFAANQSNEHLKNMFELSQQFVDNVSHEFRTPLTVIKEFASIVKDGIDGPVTEKQKDRLGTLITRTNDLALMVDDLLDTSRLESGLLKACRKEHNLRSVVAQVVKMLQPRTVAKKIKLSASGVANDLIVFCDEEKLRRVLINLLVNAIKFTPARGEIKIFTKVADQNRIQITVSDNGNGIPPEDLKLIFHRFQQIGEHSRLASCKGFGLGLSIARSLASLNLGSLEVSSEVGIGSEFSIFVPFARTDAILNCYFDQREAHPIDDGDVSVIKIQPSSVSPEDAEEVAETIDDFLQSNTKHFDLTLRADEGYWWLFACVSDEKIPNLIAQLTDQWQEVHRNQYGIDLPELSFECLQTSTLPVDRDRLSNLVITPGKNSNTAAPEENSPNAELKRLLIVDDEAEIISAMEARFTAKGFNVFTASDGQAGINSAFEIQPDAILMDIRMPGINGLEALDILKSDHRTDDIPIIILSASLHDKKVALDRGASYFIQKPFDSKSILTALKAVLLAPTVETPQQRHRADTKTDESKSPNFPPQTLKHNMRLEASQTQIN